MGHVHHRYVYLSSAEQQMHKMNTPPDANMSLQNYYSFHLTYIQSAYFLNPTMQTTDKDKYIIKPRDLICVLFCFYRTIVLPLYY